MISFRMRILVDLPENHIRELNALASEGGASRAELVRRAVAAFVSEKQAPLSDYFGLWAKEGSIEDPVAYQRRLREEW